MVRQSTAVDTGTDSSSVGLLHRKPRRILVVTHGYPPLQCHGAELHIQRKVRWWQMQGHDVRVIAANPLLASEFSFGSLNEFEDSVDGIKVLRVQFAVPDATQPLDHTFEHPLLRSILDREIVVYRPNVVYQVSGYLFGVLPLQLAQQHNIPSVLFATDYWHVCQRITLLRPDQTCCPGPRTAADCAACRFTSRNLISMLGLLPTRFMWQLAAEIGNRTTHASHLGDMLEVADFMKRESAIAEVLRDVSLVVASSQFLATRMCRAGVPNDRILVIRQGIDPNEFAGQMQSPRSHAHRSGLNVLYLGQVTRHKGVDTLVEAVGRLSVAGRNIHLDIHGPITDGTRFLDHVRIYIDNSNINLAQPLSRTEIVTALGRADVLVVPSRWYDNSPNVVLEAFSCGVPVITGNHGGTAEMVRDGVDGLLFEPGNPRSLENALRRVLDEPGLLGRLQENIQTPHGVEVEMRAEETRMDLLMPI